MAYVTLTSDLHGYLFSVDHDGRLRRLHISDGVAPAIIPHGLGDVIGANWSEVVGLTATRSNDRLLLVGRTRDGGAVTADVPVSRIAEWSGVEHTPTGAPESWRNLRTLRVGRTGELLGLARDESLWRIRVEDPTGSPVGELLTLSPPESVSEAWTARRSVFQLGDTLFDVTGDGDLRFRTDAGTEKSGDAGTWTVLAPDAGGTKGYFPSGLESVSYIDTEGRMFRRIIRLHPLTRVPVGLGDPREEARGFGKWIYRPCLVEGYCWPQSAAAGESITFHVGTRVRPVPVPGPVPYDVDFVRLRVIEPDAPEPSDDVVDGGHVPHDDAETGACPADWRESGVDWRPGFAKAIPANWNSGVYAARCTDRKGNRYYVPFVVRPSAPCSPFALLANSNTWNAYNIWGGISKYIDFPGAEETSLSFLRPNPGLAPDLPGGWMPDGTGTPAGEWSAQVGHLLRAELWVAEWLESLGPRYGFDTYSDHDLHGGRLPLVAGGRPAYKALVLNTHPEYWTPEMYRAVEKFQARGGNIVYLGGNGIYELVRIDGTQMYAYPKFPDLKVTGTIGTLRHKYLMRNRGLAEHTLLGVGFEDMTSLGGTTFVVADRARGNPILDGVSLEPFGATSLRGGRKANGWEVDRRSQALGTPPAACADDALIAHAPAGPDRDGHMLFFRNDHGGIVYSASSVSLGGALAVDTNLQRLVQNVLDACLTN